MRKLLGINTDAKTIKGTKNGILTGVMYLAPHTISGFQTCPKASTECKALCLYTAGRGIYTKIQQARIQKTVEFFTKREEFMANLVENVEYLVKKANKQNMIPAVRLNGTSDIAWEKIAVKRNGKDYASIMEAFSDVQFYDYTKVLGRNKAITLPNYHLTFSLSEENDKDAVKALDQGYNVAVVINSKRKDVKPVSWAGYPTVDGDTDDARFLDPKGNHIVLLTAKGKATKAGYGFVRKVVDTFKS